MADVFVAATAEGTSGARGLADALAALSFDASADVPPEAELTKAVDACKCVVAVWQGAPSATPPWLAALAALALERKKLVSLELGADFTPVLFHTAPRIELDARDQAVFKTRFETLVAEIEKLAPRATQPPADKTTQALATAYTSFAPAPVAASAAPPPPAAKPAKPAPSRGWTLGMVAAAVALLFVVGFGAGRLITALRSGTLIMTSASSAAITAPVAAEAPALGVTLADLEAMPWRDAAAKIDEAAAERIKAKAQSGDALGQTLACLGHLSGAPGFLPSPAAARQLCDAASGQGFPAALYLSFIVRRTAPHAAISEADARARLRAAAEQNWLPAQLDYAQLLAGDFRTPLADQTEAGRLWLVVAERGDARGQYNYARWLRDSPAGPRDPAAAVPFLERAAESDLAEAQHMLATLYRDGIGVARDPARARALYERAAEQNYPASMFNLAAMIDTGAVDDQARAAELYRSLSCMRDERQIQPMAAARLRAMRQLPAACG